MIAALDTADLDTARSWAASIGPNCGLFKLGLAFFLANGAAGYRAIAGRPIFLDLKLHDIPTTVAGAVRAVLPLRPRMLTLHAAGERRDDRARRGTPPKPRGLSGRCCSR